MLKKITGAILASVLLFGCSATPSEKDLVEQTVSSYLDDFRQGDLEEADTYIAEDAAGYRLGEAMNSLDNIYASLGLDAASISLLKTTLGTMMGALVKDYTIEEVNFDQGNEASVVVSITGLTIGEVEEIQNEDLLSTIQEAIGAGFSGNSEDALSAGLEAVLDKVSELQTTTYDATFNLIEEGNTWKINQISGLMGV